MGDAVDKGISKVIQEALRTSDLLGAEKTVEYLKNIQNINRFNGMLKKHIIQCTLDYYQIDWAFLQSNSRSDVKIHALGIISTFIVKYLKKSLQEVADILNKRRHTNVKYYMGTLNNLNDRTPKDMQLKKDIAIIESDIVEFITNYPI